MSIEGDMRERHGRVLAELAEAGMVMVRRLGEAMLEADDIQTQAQLGLTFHRVSRAVRQTVALEFRLAQDARREERGIAAPVRAARPAEATPAPTPPPRLRAERTSWDEYESDDSDELLDELDALLETEDFDLEAADEAVETCIARIRRDLDVDPALSAAGVPNKTLAPAQAAPAIRLPGGSGGRRSRLMGGAALARPPFSPPQPPLTRRSSA